MNELIEVEMHKGNVVVSSRQVAKDFTKRHNDTVDAVNAIIKDLTTENIVVKNYFIEGTYNHRGNIYRQYFLTRDGFTLLVMGFNGVEALKFKIKYIEAFNKMEAILLERQGTEWQKTRINGILQRRDTTDAIQQLIPYAMEQGSSNAKMFYVTYTKLVNRTLGIEAGKRESLDWKTLNRIAMLEDLISETVYKEMETSTYYKEIYQICKAQQFAELTYLAG